MIPPALIPPVQFLVDVLQPVLVFFHDTIGASWGMAIILLTVVVRALMAPLTVKQFKSMRAMAGVAPELKKIQEKYKDDKQRQQQEVMKFYSENKINPFASCLPLLAQFPFFIGLYYLLYTDLRREICGAAYDTAVMEGQIKGTVGGTPPECGTVPGATGHEFLFIPDLTALPTGWVLAVLLLLYVGSQLLSTLLTPSTPDRNQQMLMYGLPLVFGIFILFYGFPAGLLVYWITSNLWTVGQGYVLRRKLGPITPPPLPGKTEKPKPERAQADGDGDGAAPAEKGLMGRLAKASAAATAPAKKEPAAAAAKPAPSGPPPPPPRKKKKRSGRRR